MSFQEDSLLSFFLNQYAYKTPQTDQQQHQTYNSEISQYERSLKLITQIFFQSNHQFDGGLTQNAGNLKRLNYEIPLFLG